MANPGGGTKFASVNLNKSYGQNNPASFGSNRTRPNTHGGGGGSMVVLSRPRSSHKATGSKLSVPPPLNLPSLRKEHERFDSLGSAGGAAGGAGSGVGSRPASSGAGWTKPAAITLQEKESFSETAAVDGFDRGGSVYMPPSARSGAVAPTVPAPVAVEKAAVLRGEDFPSLRATLASASGVVQKAKENLNQKEKQFGGESLLKEQKGGSGLSSLVDADSQFKVSGSGFGIGVSENGNSGRSSSSGSRGIDQGRKQEEYFPGPLPLVRLNLRSDWADDERDTSHGLMERSREGREGRERGFSKSEAYWDRDFDMPRVGVLPHKPTHNFDKRGQRDSEAGKVSSVEVSKADPFARTASREGREGNSWRSSVSKDGFGFQDAGSERKGVAGQASGMNQELGKDNKYVASPFRDNVHDDTGKRDIGYDQGGKHPWNNSMESYGSRWPERNTRDQYAGSDQQNNRNRGFSAQSSVSKSSFSSGGRGLPINDPLLNFGREKHPVPRSEKAFLEDPFTKDFGASGFDGRDLLSAGLVGVVKKKKDVSKQTDFHDPVRESFEAELERVQRIQEQERQRIIEEQERALELARRKEEERLRQAREEEERQRRLEEEAREAAWRAEQERIEALRKAEEQRSVREEEKRRLLVEEERRKQAAKQKLLELEQKIARRQAEATKEDVGDEKMSALVKEKDSTRAAYAGDWDDSERMVERIITSASSDSSSVNRPYETGSRAHFSRDVSSSSFIDGGKPVNSWRRDVYENGSSSGLYLQDQDNSHSSNSPRRDSSIVGKPFMRKDHYGGTGFMSSRTYYRGGIADSHLDEYAHVKGQRWNQSGDGDHFIRNTETDSDFRENFVERFGDGWAQIRPRGNPIPPYPERSYQNSESYGPYGLGRSRYSVRQPRVLPPPTLAPVHKNYRNGNEHPGPSAFLENELRYDQATSGESSMPTGYDNRACEQPGVVDALQEIAENKDRGVETTHGCDSQSSLSVSSPPSSPTHLSHDDLDETGDSYVVLGSEEGRNGSLSASENESITLSARAQNENAVTSSHDVSTADDENEWAAENNEQFQQQDEYDEEEDYQEEDEVHEVDDNIGLNQGFENMHLEEKGLPLMMDNLVLGFDDGVQVGMPNEEFERTSNDEETTYMPQQASISKIEEQVSFDNACNDGKVPPVDDPSKVNLNNSSMFQEQGKPTQDLVIQSSDSHSSSVSDSLGNLENSSGMSTHCTVPTSGTISPHSSFGQNVMSNVAATPSQADLPVKLQFGLFSGPSLIPSPVPAIQIGSIQMPLHLGPSISHVHPSQPPLFQFGQLRYTSPISQGIMPLGPQSMSFVQPNIPSDFSFNHNPGGQLPLRSVPGNSHGFFKSEVKPHSVENQPGDSRQLSQSSLPIKSAENLVGIKQDHIDVPSNSNNIMRTTTGVQVDKQGNRNLVGNGSLASSNVNESEGHSLTRDASIHLVSKDKDTMHSKAQFPVSGGRGKKYVFMAKPPGSRSSGPTPRANRPDSRGFLRRPRRTNQHTEFRVRDSAEKRQTANLVLSDQVGSDNKSNFNGRGTVIPGRNGPRKSLANKLGKQAAESAVENSQQINSGNGADKVDGKESAKTQSISHSGHSILKRNSCSEDNEDAPLHSGIIRVFEQPGIEAPSDDDDFIEVRSKRQMLHDRREQREKEIKAKSQVAKIPRKPRSTLQNAVTLNNSSKGSISTGEVVNGARAHLVVAEGHGMAKLDVSSGINSSVSPQPLAPIGTPPLKIDSQSDLSSQTSRSVQVTLPAVSGGGKGTGSGVIFENKNKVDDVQTSLGSWGHVPIGQQVMALTQTQLDEAMNPQQFDSRASIGDLSSGVNESSLPTSAILTKDKSFSSSSPVNSLLAGEKIQFGAVTSPTVLPSNGRSVSHGIGPPGSSRSDVKLSHKLGGSDNDCSIFFDKKKHNNESRSHLEDCEAEAAASAVAVAAISSDEIVGNGSGTHSVSVSDAKSLVAADIDGRAAGVASEQQSAIQSRSEEPLSVSLPADLSVETPSISLWSPLPSQQNSSGQLISHFPPGPPHFPFYEMNPMMGGPVITFGPHDESASTAQPQLQKRTPSVSGPIGGWHQCHPGVDSFYGPPTGFTGPFITPPGGIPGVQGPPHMVVYNHFAPVGQYGQVGMSFMGTYIPSGKQPDWKHNPTSSAMGAVEGDVNMNVVSSLRNPAANMPSPIQHLAPGSPLVPMASPLPMFDVSPFQSTEMSVQARWPHVPNSPQPSIPLSLQQQGVNASQYGQGPSVDRQLTVNRFTGAQTSTSDVNVNQLPDVLGLADHSDTGAMKVSAQNLANKASSNAAKADVHNGSASSSNNQNESSASKGQISQQNSNSSQQHDHSSGYTNYKRGGNVSQRNISSGGEWSHRRMGFQVRNQSMGADKNYSSSKVKQIYVAKQSTGRASSMS